MPINANLIIIIGSMIALSIFCIILFINRNKSKKSRIIFFAGLFISYLILMSIISLLQSMSIYEEESFERILWGHLTNVSAIALYLILITTLIANKLYLGKKEKGKNSNKE
ncbi:MAG: hypothetical protein LBL13_12500 [Bacteroidales bacterium]|jgi:membrane protease YdiL (CAAX protease family)|nr:hypothetical protein [Bacteroidales bacterium]